VALHTEHDIVAHRSGLAGETATTVWLAATFVAYSALILWLRRVGSEDAADGAVSPNESDAR
jgi:hypothetical protein